MKRRQVLKISTAVLAYTMSIGATAAVLGGCRADTRKHWIPIILSPEQAALIEEASERIIPNTDIPGAREAYVHRYIDEALKNNYTEENRIEFLESLAEIELESQNQYNKAFIDCTSDEMDAVLSSLAAAEAKVFRELRSLTVSGYLGSEIGTKQLLKYDPLPGNWDSCIDFEMVGGRWA